MTNTSVKAKLDNEAHMRRYGLMNTTNEKHAEDIQG